MNNRKIIKEYQILKSSTLGGNTSTNKFKDGIVYTFYSEEFNSIKVGFAENKRVLEYKLSIDKLILLDTNKGNKKDLFLLVKTLKEFGIKYSDHFSLKYSNSLMRHLSILGWPIGRSLYKQRKIKKKLIYA